MTQARETVKPVEALPERTKQAEEQPDNHVRLHPFLTLQRQAGNRAVTQLLRTLGSSPAVKNDDTYQQPFPLFRVVRPKLKSGGSPDAFEDEADRAANQADLGPDRRLPNKTSAASTDEASQTSGSKEKVFTDVVNAMKSDLDRAWIDATTTWKEWGGFIVRNETSGEIKIEDYKEGQRGMKVEWRVGKYRPGEGHALIGEFHTHQYSPKEVKDFQKNVPSFTGEDVGFDTGDLLAAARYFEQDYVAIVISGKTIFGFVVSAPALATKFAKSEYGAGAIDEADADLNEDFHRGKISGDYGEKSWEGLKNVVANYEKELGQSPGIEFFRIAR